MRQYYSDLVQRSSDGAVAYLQGGSGCCQSESCGCQSGPSCCPSAIIGPTGPVGPTGAVIYTQRKIHAKIF